MKKTPVLPTIALSLVLAAAGSLPVIVSLPTPAYAAKQPTISPKIGKLLTEVTEHLKKGQTKEAIAKGLEADASEGKSPFETALTKDYLGQAYVGAQDYTNAADAFAAAYATGALPDDMKSNRLKIVVQLYLQTSNYPKSIEAGKTYLKDFGNDPEIQGFIGQAYYMNKDSKNAAIEIRKAIDMADAAKTPPRPEWFNILEHAENEAGNVAGVIAAQEMSVQRFPSKEGWASLLTNVANNIRGNDKVTLDIFRLMLTLDVMKNASDFMEMAKVAMQEQLPGDAKRALQKGFESGALGVGSGKAEQTQLLNKATAAADADQKSLASTVQLAAQQKTGDADIKFGEAFISYGQYDQAISAIQRGIGKGVKDPDDAQLRLGLALLGAGKKTEAVAAFNSIKASTPTAKIAHLWALYAAQAAT